MLKFVIPQLRTFFGEDHHFSLGQKFLFFLSDASVNHPILFVLSIVITSCVLFLCLKKLFSIQLGSHFFFREKSFEQSAKYEGITWLSTLSILLQSGIMTKDALVLSTHQVSNQSFKNAVERIITNVINGLPLHLAMQQEKWLPKSATKFAELGESSGTLGIMLAQSAELEMQNFMDRIDRRILLLKPILLILLGGSILWIITEVISPLYDGLIVIQ
jgi:type II secretory pathway component PulF